MNETTTNQGGQKVNKTQEFNEKLENANAQIIALRFVISAFWDRLDSDIQSRIRAVDTLEIK